MTPIIPEQHSQETVIGALRNAAQIARARIEPTCGCEDCETVARIAELLLVAIEGLSEPSLPAVQAAATMLREAQAESQGFTVNSRYARDCAAAILRAQVTGEIPQTWETE